MAKLIVTTPEGESVVELQPGQVITVGRDPTNRIPLEGDTQASRRHCRIGPRESGGDGWEVVDLGSTNKTRVDGQPVQRRALSHGDVVEVGHAHIRLDDPQEAERIEQATREGVCYLEWVDKDHRGEKVLLQQPRVTVGRRESNTIVLDDRMVSSHHCEITKDVNGYTIRDLGSTNGTLLNGDPIQEALLAHGSRLRIGNARFVFKDPSMKDVDVELSQFEEDEGWGMMGEIDLSHRHGSKAGPLLVLLLFLAAAGGGYFLAQQGENDSAAAEALATGLVENGRFEEEDVFWGADDPERVEVARRANAGQKRSGGLVLTARNESGDGNVLVAYQEPIEVSSLKAVQVAGALKGQGEARSDLVLVWSSLAPSRGADGEERKQTGLVTPVARMDSLVQGRGSWQTVETRREPPPWAKVVRLGVWLEPGARASLDDVRVFLVPREAEAASLDVPTFKKATVGRSGGLDVLQSRIVMVSDARPIIRVGGEALTNFAATSAPQLNGDTVAVEGVFVGKDGEIPATVSWQRTAEGLTFVARCAAAEAVGLDVGLPLTHLGGALSVLGDFPPQRIPAEPGGEPLPGVARTLAGEAEPSGGRPATLLAFTQVDDKPVAGLQVVGAPLGDVLHVRHWLEGTEARMGVVTDFSKQREQAQRALQEARGLMRTRPAEAFDQFRTIAQAYPFEEDIRDDALRLSGELEDQALKDLSALETALRDFNIYKSPGALASLRDLSTRLAGQFLADGDATGKGPIVERVAELVTSAQESERTWLIERATPSVERLERLVTLLEGVEDYRPLAAVYAQTLIDRYEDLAPFAPDIQRRVEVAKDRFDKLVESEAVRDALPPKP